MAGLHSAPTSSSSSGLQSLLLPSLKLRHPFLFSHSFTSYLSSKRLNNNHGHGLRLVRASANVATTDPGNGALLTPEKNPNVTSYGRQYFPLAAVVGQVLFFSLSLSLSIEKLL